MSRLAVARFDWRPFLISLVDEGLAHIQKRTWFMYTRTNIITSWRQGAVGSKADIIKSQDARFNWTSPWFYLIVLCCVMRKANNRKCMLICFYIWFQFRSLYIIFTVLARQVLVQSSSSSRARSKRVMNQTMFDVPDPLVVHVLLLTHEMFNNICLPHSWYPQFDSPCFLCAQNSQMIPPLWFIAVGWSWQMHDCLLILFVLQCHKQYWWLVLWTSRSVSCCMRTIFASWVMNQTSCSVCWISLVFMLPGKSWLWMRRNRWWCILAGLMCGSLCRSTVVLSSLQLIHLNIWAWHLHELWV